MSCSRLLFVLLLSHFHRLPASNSDYRWKEGPWQQGKCDTDHQSREVYCVDGNNNEVIADFCSELEEPVAKRVVPEEESDMVEAVIGVAFTIAGIFIDNLGVTVMKISHNKNVDVVTGTKKPYWKQKRWLLGFLLFCIGNLLNAVGLSYAPQSLFAAVGSLTLVFNALNAWLILHEKITSRIIFGTVLIVGGSLIAVFFGSHHSASLTLNDLFQHLVNFEFLIYLGVILVSLFCTIVYIHRLERKQKANVRGPGVPENANPKPIIITPKDLSANLHDSQNPSLGTGGGTASFWARRIRTRRGLEEPNPSFSTSTCPSEPPYGHNQLSFLYPFLTGMIGQFTVLLAKASAELVANSIACDSQFGNPWTYVVIVGMLSVGATQVHWLNRGLARYDQILVIPVFNVSYALFSVLSGGMFYREFDDFTMTKWIVFPLSILLTFIGVYFITVPSGKGSLSSVDSDSLHISINTDSGPDSPSPKTQMNGFTSTPDSGETPETGAPRKNQNVAIIATIEMTTPQRDDTATAGEQEKESDAGEVDSETRSEGQESESDEYSDSSTSHECGAVPALEVADLPELEPVEVKYRT